MCNDGIIQRYSVCVEDVGIPARENHISAELQTYWL